ncbi:Thioredoxin superfamily protein [Perilla frutescens var. hirtella]|uniref:Thioredoxin superfamily protein n=1 Tax=Perilla frutescens var. hirtella TaxID=608512 RepID=A0AAD4J7N1_PERFH|nr:Thioredoxin superfamily protein [Perilla frutescens var. frutescens]KAH6782996.1 Thioredoxin superfamily protein [Perilla frutescens var. hirtella]KAH6828469.1 Thioredoxin superfamily protein [Perilla frutescens var. hirtella]
MQGVRRYGMLADGGVRLELTPTTVSPLAIDVEESAAMRIQRLISENPVIIFSRSSCCMCHVMKRLLSTIGVHPTVIELEEDEIAALSDDSGAASAAPALYIGGACVGGLESLVALHLSNNLVPKLVEVGALKNEFLNS